MKWHITLLTDDFILKGVGQAVGQAAAIIRKANERRRGGFGRGRGGGRGGGRDGGRGGGRGFGVGGRGRHGSFGGPPQGQYYGQR